MNDREMLELADAYASQLQAGNFDDADHARAALEAALSAKQGEQDGTFINEGTKEQEAQMLGALIDIAYGLESARIWGGMDWTYNPLHPCKYLPLRDKARAAIAAVKGNT